MVFETIAIDHSANLPSPQNFSKSVHPAGIEPASKDPQSFILSVELWVRGEHSIL